MCGRRILSRWSSLLSIALFASILILISRQNKSNLYNPQNEQLLQRQHHVPPEDTIAVLMMVCNRAGFTRALDLVLNYMPKKDHDIIVSQDCAKPEITRLIQEYGDKITVHMQQPDQSKPKIDRSLDWWLDFIKEPVSVTFKRVSRHYGWALQQVFDTLHYQQIIIVEDDLEISPDFFDYFRAFLPLLRSDSSLFCVSAWNDNGYPFIAEDPRLFYRTDYFPGLGWMMTSSFWNEIREKWPRIYWDDWLRREDIRNGRSCVRPEISRTKNFGRIGTSNSDFFDQYLSKLTFNTEKIDYRSFDVSMYDKNHYDESFYKNATSSLVVTYENLLDLIHSRDPTHHELYVKSTPGWCGVTCKRRFQLRYTRAMLNNKELEKSLKEWGLMNDLRLGIARTSYMGVVPFKAKFKYPPSDEEKYVQIFFTPSER